MHLCWRNYCFIEQVNQSQIIILPAISGYTSTAKFAAALLLLIVIGAIFAPWLTPYAPEKTFFDGLTIEGAPLPPSLKYWFGTDLLGRDLFSRVVFGAQTSLLIGVIANGISLVLGTLVGVFAGFLRGWVGSVLMRFTDLMMCFPALLLAIVLSAIFTPSLWIVAIVIAMVNWVQVARVVYTQTVSLAERGFVEAARSLGATPIYILFRHIVPHLVPALVVYGTLGIATTVLLEATLSFLGIGVQPPTPSWGNIIFENQSYFTTAPWLVFIPGSAIVLLAVCFNVLGDALREALDPTLGARRT
jgi:peptide/nickel transport system permease protein